MAITGAGLAGGGSTFTQVKRFLNTSGQDNIKKMWFNLGTQMAEFMGMEVAGNLAGSSIVPDVLIGWLPLYGVQDVDSAVSNKQLRFRSFGGHLLSFQAGEHESLIITLRLCGRYALIWLSILEYYYIEGEPRPSIRGIPQSEILNAGPLARPFTQPGGFFGQIFRSPYNTVTGGEISTIGDLNAIQDVDLVNDTYVEKKSQIPPLKQEKIQNYEILWRHKTFNVITKHKVWTRMFIETMRTSKSVAHGKEEYEVQLLLRKYLDPPRKLYMKVTEVMKGMEGIINKKTILDRLKSMAARDVQGARQAYNDLSNAKTGSKKGQSLQIKQRIASKKWWNTTQKTYLFVNPYQQGYTKMKIGGVRRGLAWQEWFVNFLWRSGWVVSDTYKHPGLATNDPLASKIQLIGVTISKSMGNDRREYVSDNTFMEKGTKRRKYESGTSFTGTGEGSRTYITDASFPEGAGQSRAYAPDPSFVGDPSKLKVDVTIGEQQDMETTISAYQFLESLGIEQTITVATTPTIDDYLVTVPQKKQGDFENCCLLGATVREFNGSIVGSGQLVFNFPFDFHIEVTRRTDPFANPISIKMITGNYHMEISPGLVFFLGSSDKAVWDTATITNDDDELVEVNYVKKPKSDEVYMYISEIVENGVTTIIKGFFIHPTYGI